MKKEDLFNGTIIAAQPGFYVLTYCYDPSYLEKPFEYWKHPVIAWAICTEYNALSVPMPITIEEAISVDDYCADTVLYPDGRVARCFEGETYESINEWIVATKAAEDKRIAALPASKKA